MRDVRCIDCAEYRDNWCEKIIDSPHPWMLRDCQYWHKRKDMVEVVRCRDCYWWAKQEDSVQGRCCLLRIHPAGGWYCANGKRKGADNG